MQKLPVTRDGKRGSEIIVIDANDVVKIEQFKENQYIVHTKNDQFYLYISLESIEEWLFEDGFRMIDSTNIVNMYHVKKYDERRGIVFLGDEKNPETKTASAARIHREHIQNVMKIMDLTNKEEADDCKEEQMEEWLQSLNVREHDDKFLRSYATIHTVNEKKKTEKKLVHMAYHDALTDLPNRLLFQNRLNQLVNTCSPAYDCMAAVIFLDVDRFKVINDSLGHHIGDEVLIQIGKRIRSSVQQGMAARFSGDEFIILLDDIRHIDEATGFVKQLLTSLNEPILLGSHELYVSASIGISLYPFDGMDAETLIKNADTAMYRAKEKGGNTFQIYHSDMNNRSVERLNLETDLRKALDRNEIQVYYQPIVELSSGCIAGMEALVRWRHPKRGLISPAQFIPLAEETGLITPIGNYVLKQACLQNISWVNKGLRPLNVSVNISASQFHHANFVQNVEKILLETGLHPSWLNLEITENVAMKNNSYIQDTISQLENLGLKISIDDFGTGYSSLSYLKRFHVHTLKIDQSFIRDVTRDDDNAAIVTALIAMSHQLKIQPLAEGVENEEQLYFLKRQGCSYIQGYVFSKPLPCNEFEQLLIEDRNLFSAI